MFVCVLDGLGVLEKRLQTGLCVYELGGGLGKGGTQDNLYACVWGGGLRKGDIKTACVSWTPGFLGKGRG